MIQENNYSISLFISTIYAIVIFFVVFNPPIVSGFSFTKASVVGSTVIIVLNMRYIKSIFSSSRVKGLMGSFFVFYLYYSFICVINLFSDYNLLIEIAFVETSVNYLSFFLVTFAIVVWVIRRGMTINDLCRIFVLAALIQSIIAVMCLLSPSIKTLLNGMMILNTDSEKIMRSVEYDYAHRNYGFASTLYDIFGFTMAVFGIIAIKLGLNGRRLYFIIGFLFAMVSGINARSGFMIFMIGFVAMMLGKKSKRGYGKRLLFLTLIIIFVMLLFFWIMNNTYSEQALWLSEGLREIQSMSNGKSEGYFDILWNEFVFFPEGFSLLFGTGTIPDLLVKKHSDVGYIQNIWQFGIIGSILLYIFFYKLLKEAYRFLSWPDSTMIRCFILMISVYMIKLTCLGYSMASIVFAPICFVAICYSDERLKNADNEILIQ